MRWSGSGTSTAPSTSSNRRKAAALGGEFERFADFDDRADIRRVAQHGYIFAGISVEDDDIRDHPRLDRAELALKCSERREFRYEQGKIAPRGSEKPLPVFGKQCKNKYL